MPSRQALHKAGDTIRSRGDRNLDHCAVRQPDLNVAAALTAGAADLLRVLLNRSHRCGQGDGENLNWHETFSPTPGRLGAKRLAPTVNLVSLKTMPARYGRSTLIPAKRLVHDLALLIRVQLRR